MLLQTLDAERSATLSACVTKGYEASLKQYHGMAVKLVFKGAVNACPSRSWLWRAPGGVGARLRIPERRLSSSLTACRGLSSPPPAAPKMSVVSPSPTRYRDKFMKGLAATEEEALAKIAELMPTVNEARARARYERLLLRRCRHLCHSHQLLLRRHLQQPHHHLRPPPPPPLRLTAPFRLLGPRHQRQVPRGQGPQDLRRPRRAAREEGMARASAAAEACTCGFPGLTGRHRRALDRDTCTRRGRRGLHSPPLFTWGRARARRYTRMSVLDQQRRRSSSLYTLSILHGACLAQTVAESVAFESTLPFMALTTSSLLEPLAISSRPDSAYSLKLAVLPFLLGPR